MIYSRQVDHIVCESRTPESLFQVFHSRLNLPEAWPFRDYGNFLSGGVCLGNVNLEFLKVGTLRSSPSPAVTASTQDRFCGIALEPNETLGGLKLKLSQAEIETNDIFRSPNFSTMFLNGFFDITENLFFCEYHFDLTAFRKSLTARLKQSEGGFLGLKRVSEINLHIGPNSGSKIENWKKLLGQPTGDGVIDLGSGPAIRLSEGSGSLIDSIVLDVQSKRVAREHLVKGGLTEEVSGDQGERIVLNGGLQIKLQD